MIPVLLGLGAIIGGFFVFANWEEVVGWLNELFPKVKKALADADREITLAELVAGVDLEDVTPGRVAYYAGKLVKAEKIVRDKAKVGDRKVTVFKLA